VKILKKNIGLIKIPFVVICFKPISPRHNAKATKKDCKSVGIARIREKKDDDTKYAEGCLNS